MLRDVFKMRLDDLRCSDMFSEDHICWMLDFLQILSRCSLDVLRMFSGSSQDFPRISSRCFDGPCERGGSGGSGWSFGSSGSGGSGGSGGSCGSSTNTIVGLVGLVSLIGWMGLEWLVSLVGIFFLFDLIQKYFQMKLLSFMTHKNLMILTPLVV